MSAATPGYVIGVDVGGTFTDVLCIRTDGTVVGSTKVPSIPGEQWKGVIDAVSGLKIELDQVRAIVHGTTIATNTILERKGAKTALLTTIGFRDALEIGRTRRMVGGLFEFKFVRPKPLAERALRYEIAERIAADGTVLVPLDGAAISGFVELCGREGVEAVAVGFLNSHVNPDHERTAREHLRAALPDRFTCASSDLTLERGEFERFSTAVVNAYLGPVIARYIASLTEVLDGARVSAPISIMGSHGGAMTLAEAGRAPVKTFLSGPVGGAIGAAAIAAAAGIGDFITFDMGGTSTDVGLFPGGRARMSFDNRIDAFPLRVPQVDINTIGAGGGSIAARGADGTLEVGPRSAGAVPGPACYGRGGTQATVSDANLLLGRLRADRPLGGKLTLSAGLAEDAFRRLADDLRVDDVLGLADGVIRVAVAKMAGAVREVTVYRGHDPRSFALMAFGGAGPMHAFLVAEELGIERVVVPRWPGHLSALGQLSADRRYDDLVHLALRLSAIAPGTLDAAIGRLEAAARVKLDEDGFVRSRQRIRFSADLRYVGQSFTLSVPVSADRANADALRQAHQALHRETFGYADEQGDIEVMAMRVVAEGQVDPVSLHFKPDRSGAPRIGEARLWFAGAWHRSPLVLRDRLEVGAEIAGPALIEEAGSTTVVPPGWMVRVDSVGNLIGMVKS